MFDYDFMIWLPNMYIYIYIYYYIHIIITLMIILSIFARSLDSWAMRGPSSARGGGFQLSRCFRCVLWGIHRMKSSILLWDVHIIELDDGKKLQESPINLMVKNMVSG